MNLPLKKKEKKNAQVPYQLISSPLKLCVCCYQLVVFLSPLLFIKRQVRCECASSLEALFQPFWSFSGESVAFAAETFSSREREREKLRDCI